MAREAIARHISGGISLPELLRLLESTAPVDARGSIVVATLPGDVHDIGTALLKTVLSTCGYKVHDLGKQVPIEKIIDAAVELKTDAIGLSALLVTSSRQMPLCVQALDALGLDIPVLVGGAAINRAFGRRSGILPDGRVYAAGVFYCRDVFEGLAAMDALTDPRQRPVVIEQARREIAAERDQPVVPVRARSTRGATLLPGVEVPSPPYWGARRREADLREVWRSLDRNTLFRFHWGGYRVADTRYPTLVRELFEPALDELMAEAVRDGWLEARIVSGYFACNAAGESLVLDNGVHLEFPRQPDGERLCLVDYFRPLAAGVRDVVVLQAVTVGPRAGALIERLQREGAYARMLLVNGLASATAEALAEHANQLARADLGLASARGLRFSWGYAACPDLAEQRKVLPLLGSESEIGLSLTDSDTLTPEHSTVAIVVHHPEAKYFSVR
jgi:5-methyltetrahydrofolate--homocysteine methyltransferase